jgi:hypothetical protein
MRRIVVVLACAASIARAGNSADPKVERELARRFASDAKAATIALALYRETGDTIDVGADEIMDGGYRGKIHLVPQLPTGGYRAHLVWVAAAMKDIDAFFGEVFPPDVGAPAYRWQPLAFRFVRSVGKHTPSAYASAWTIAYNVEGSLLTSAAGVRETLWHELFHLNDEQHGDWSAKTLAGDYAAIVQQCGARLHCLRPYAPNDTVVRGGTFYAFQQNNGDSVHEYAAELAVRYFKEQREMKAAGKLSRRAFKCGPSPNARVWQALVDEFFGGRDLVPLCS